MVRSLVVIAAIVVASALIVPTVSAAASLASGDAPHAVGV